MAEDKRYFAFLDNAVKKSNKNEESEHKKKMKEYSEKTKETEEMQKNLDKKLAESIAASNKNNEAAQENMRKANEMQTNMMRGLGAATAKLYNDLGYLQNNDQNQGARLLDLENRSDNQLMYKPRMEKTKETEEMQKNLDKKLAESIAASNKNNEAAQENMRKANEMEPCIDGLLMEAVDQGNVVTVRDILSNNYHNLNQNLLKLALKTAEMKKHMPIVMAITTAMKQKEKKQRPGIDGKLMKAIDEGNIPAVTDIMMNHIRDLDSNIVNLALKTSQEKKQTTITMIIVNAMEINGKK